MKISSIQGWIMRQNKNVTFRIFVDRKPKSVFVGSCFLETAETIHAGTIKKVNYDSKTILLDPEKSPYGKE
jgi:hypothetical protein